MLASLLSVSQKWLSHSPDGKWKIPRMVPHGWSCKSAVAARQSMWLPLHPTKVAAPTASSSASMLKQQPLLNRLTNDKHGCWSQHVSNSDSASIKHLLLLPSPTASSTLSCDMNLCSVHVELCSSLLQGAGSLLVSTSEAHWPASPNSCMSCSLIITPLEGVISFNHIQISTSDRLSDPLSSCWMAVGTLGYAATKTASTACCWVCPP